MPEFDRRQFLLGSGAAAGLAVVRPVPALAGLARGRVTSLKVDYLDQPLGLENTHPVFSWRLESTQRNVSQSAYRLNVASSLEALQAGKADLWDTGEVRSRRSFGIAYSGRPLTSRERVWWAVQVWDERSQPWPRSDPAWWEMGLLDSKEWVAQWLAVEDGVARVDREAGLHWIWGGAALEDTRPRQFRFTLHLPGPAKDGQLLVVSSETTSIAGAWIDGRLLGPDVAGVAGVWHSLGPLGAGKHVLAVQVNVSGVTDMTVRTRGLTTFMRVELQNGETLRISSVTGWKVSSTPAPGWPEPGYDDGPWEDAQPADLQYQPWPPTPAMYLRRAFDVKKPIAKALLYATALGAYEAHINGHRVGDALLTPEPAQYATRVLYRAYDVTRQVVEGANALALTVGDGWYASYESFTGRFPWAPPPRRVLAQLEITHEDGSREVIATGPEWRTAPSPIQCSEISVGEVYDARLEQSGWALAVFNDATWSQAAVAERPVCRLMSQVSPPIREIDRLRPKTISQSKERAYRIDFGQNFAGWCRLKVRGARGTRIELRFAELPEELESTDRMGMGKPKRDVYILRGDPNGEVFEPHFTYRGFRYMEVTGLAEAPTEASIEGVVIHSDLPITGRFTTDVPLLGQISRNILWSQRSNFVGVPTDCPSREQRGWMGDAAIFWETAAFNMDVCAFTARHMNNVIDDQGADGAFPIAAPEPAAGFFFSVADGTAPAWGDGGIILPWTVWRRYGDASIIERYWEAMNRHVEFILKHNPDYVWRHKRGRDFGDWLTPDQVLSLPPRNSSTPRDLIATAYWYHSTDLLAQMSEAIDRFPDATSLRELSRRIWQAFNETFVSADGTVGNGSQTSQVLALKFGLLPEELRPAAAAKLAKDIHRRDLALSTGFLGTQFILDVLADHGYADVAYGLLLRTAYPSWGHMVEFGATTVWETWSGSVEFEDHTLHAVSQNHYGLGALGGFLYRRVAGIDEASPGFETILIRPVLDLRVKHGGGDYDSVMGRISTDWQWTSDRTFRLDAIIPANARARIHLPASRQSRITEGGRPIARRAQITMLNHRDLETVVEVGSGSYQFVVEAFR